MNIELLFPVPIGFDNLSKSLTQKQVDFISKQPMRSNITNRSSLNNYLLESSELADVKQELNRAINNYFQMVFAPKDDVSLYITQSWSNVTHPGECHHAHTHPNSFISGVLYVSTDATDNIMFVRPMVNGISVNVDAVEWNIFNSITWQYPVKSGGIVLFPSSLGHEVPTTVSKTSRVSLAFNTFLRGRLGDPSDLTELHLS